MLQRQGICEENGVCGQGEEDGAGPAYVWGTEGRGCCGYL